MLWAQSLLALAKQRDVCHCADARVRGVTGGCGPERGRLGSHEYSSAYSPVQRGCCGRYRSAGRSARRCRRRPPQLTMANNGNRYRDYLGGSEKRATIPASPPPPPLASAPIVIVNVNRHDETWSAVWQSGNGLLGSFDSGTRESAISWARQRCENILIFSPEQGDLVPLGQL